MTGGVLLDAAIERLYHTNVGVVGVGKEGHPTNGLALCKNHHWAMDRNLIAPVPDHHWHVSKILDPRHSNGKKELIELSGKTLLLPQDEAIPPGGGRTEVDV